MDLYSFVGDSSVSLVEQKRKERRDELLRSVGIEPVVMLGSPAAPATARSSAAPSSSSASLKPGSSGPRQKQNRHVTHPPPHERGLTLASYSVALL